MSLWLSGLLLSFWIVLMLVLIYKLGSAIVGYLFCILVAIPVVRYLWHLIMAVVLLPWVGLHELCHAVAVVLAGGEIVGINLIPETRDGGLVLGSTLPTEMGPLFVGFVFAAPLLVGNVVVLLMLVYVFRVPWMLLLSRHERIFQTFWDVAQMIGWNGGLITIYLLFSAGNGSMPGSTDWEGVGRCLGAILVILLVATGALLSVTHTVILDQGAFDWWLSGLSMLAIQLTVIVVMDVAVWLVLLLPGKLAIWYLTSR